MAIGQAASQALAVLHLSGRKKRNKSWLDSCIALFNEKNKLKLVLTVYCFTFIQSGAAINNIAFTGVTSDFPQ